jgi:hypothetical protein
LAQALEGKAILEELTTFAALTKDETLIMRDE